MSPRLARHGRELVPELPVGVVVVLSAVSDAGPALYPPRFLQPHPEVEQCSDAGPAVKVRGNTHITSREMESETRCLLKDQTTTIQMPGKSAMADAHEHLVCVREALAGYAEYAGFTPAEILLPSMPESTRQHASGQVLLSLLAAVDSPDEARTYGSNHPNDVDRLRRFVDAPFLVCTLQHPETGVQIAVLDREL